MTEGKFSTGFQGQNHQNGVALYLTENPEKSLDRGRVNWAFQQETFDSDSDTVNGDDSQPRESYYGDERKERTFDVDTHSIILDISTTGFVDTVTVKTLKNVRVCKGLHAMTFMYQSVFNMLSYISFKKCFNYKVNIMSVLFS